MGYERNDGRDRDRYGAAGRSDRDDNRSWNSPRGSYGSGYGQNDGGRSQGYGGQGYGGRDYGRDADRDYRARDYGRQPQGYDYDDRGFFDRAGDEVRSWFGDEEAERRRRLDERYQEREDGGRFASDSYGGGSGGYRSSTGSGRAGGGHASDYGVGRGAGATSTWGLGGGSAHDGWGQDPNYRSWRDRQMADFDRDYHEYRREHQSKFDQEFHGWRQQRQTQRSSLGQVQEHQEVVGSDGQHVGTVDKVRGDRIILTKSDQDAGGHHHSIPSSWISQVSDAVTISKTADQAKQHWRDEERNAGSGWNSRDDERNRDRTPSRSFSGNE